jgi:hypothetical protein
MAVPAIRSSRQNLRDVRSQLRGVLGMALQIVECPEDKRDRISRPLMRQRGESLESFRAHL